MSRFLELKSQISGFCSKNAHLSIVAGPKATLSWQPWWRPRGRGGRLIFFTSTENFGVRVLSMYWSSALTPSSSLILIFRHLVGVMSGQKGKSRKDKVREGLNLNLSFIRLSHIGILCVLSMSHFECIRMTIHFHKDIAAAAYQCKIMQA